MRLALPATTRGRTVTCRICGICAIGHTTASLRATEDALGITPSEQTMELRKLLLNAEMIQSHVLHIFFLAAPDFFGAPDVLPLAESHREAVGIALRLKRMANQVAGIIAGRHIHPISAVVNGFSKWPDRRELRDIQRTLEDRRSDLEQAVAFAAGLTQPKLDTTNEFVSLKSAAEYAFYDGEICSTTGQRVAARDSGDCCSQASPGFLRLTQSRALKKEWHHDHDRRPGSDRLFQGCAETAARIGTAVRTPR